MTPEQAQDETPIPVIAILSGGRRGQTVRLSGRTLRIGTAAESELWFRAERDPEVGAHHARLEHRGRTYELVVETDAEIWVNGEPVEHLVLASGDLLEIGRGGPVIRFRVYPPGTPTHKTLGEVFSDCRDCALHGGTGPISRASIMLSGTPRELASQTSLPFRVSVLALLVVLLIASFELARRSRALEERLASEITGINEILERSEAIRSGDLSEIRGELEGQLTSATERLATLEARSGAVKRVVTGAAHSVAFLQGAYSFYDPQTGRPLRFAGMRPDGTPLRDQRGQPRVGLDGNGPVIESLYTGTAFVVSRRDLLITNRHVAEPWSYDDSAQALVAQGLEPRMGRFIGYLPGVEEPFEVQTVSTSPIADVALLKCSGEAAGVTPLQLADEPPRAGDEVIVLGYPTGIRALLARTDQSFIDQLMEQVNLDFWTVAGRLSRGGHIGPLASRGIVGQVTNAAVVYDAETTQGGSGGPVLNLEGMVVAVNTAVLPEFGGSNLGVPAEHGLRLLVAASED